MLAHLLLASTALAASPWQAPRVAGGHCEAPQFSAGADRIAWALNFHEARRIETWVATPPAAPEPVTVGAAGPGAPAAFGSSQPGVVHDLTWAPPSALTFQGQYVVAASTPAGHQDLFLSLLQDPIASASGHDGDPAWNPVHEGLLVYTSSRTGQGDLYLHDFANPATPRQLTRLPDAAEVDAAWAPDGQALAFVAHTESGDNIWVLDRFDAEPRRLTTASGSDTVPTQVRPQWAPAGVPRLAYYQYNRGDQDTPDRVDLMVATAAGAARRVLSGVVPDSAGPTWTPDGKSLVVVLDDDGRFDPVVKVDASSGATTPIDTGTVGNRDLTVGRTPDGTLRLAVCAQGLVDDSRRDFRRVVVLDLP